MLTMVVVWDRVSWVALVLHVAPCVRIEFPVLRYVGVTIHRVWLVWIDRRKRSRVLVPIPRNVIPLLSMGVLLLVLLGVLVRMLEMGLALWGRSHTVDWVPCMAVLLA